MNIDRQYPAEGTEDVQRGISRQGGMLERLRSSYVGAAGKIGVVLVTMLGNVPKTSGVERTDSPVRMLFSTDLQQLREGKAKAGDVSAKILSITDDPTGKEDSFLRMACEEALAIAAEANDERSVIATLEKMKSLPAASNPQIRLFNDTELGASILVALDKATKANQFAMALQLIDLLENSGLLNAEAAWLKRAEILEAKPVPNDPNSKFADAKMQIELGARAAEGKHIAATKRIAIDSDKITQRLPSGEISLPVRQEALQLLAVSRAMELIEKTGGTKMEHSVLGLFHLSRGNIKEAYAEFELGGHPYVTRFPMSDDPLEQYAVAQKIALDLEKGTKMSPIEAGRLRNLCAFFARQALASNVLMNEKRVLAERFAKLSAAAPAAVTSTISLTRPTDAPMSASTPPLSAPTAPPKASAAPAGPALNIDVSNPQVVAGFFLAQGCSIFCDTADKKRVRLEGRTAVFPPDGKFYSINVPPTSCNPDVVWALSQMKAETRVSMVNCPLPDEAVALLLKNEAIFGLNLQNTKMTDASLAQMPEASKLNNICLSGTKISDAAIAHLAKNKSLTHLILSETAISDAGLAAFEGVNHVRIIDLSGTQTTGKGLRHLTGSPVRELKLNGTPLQNADVDALVQFTSVEVLHLGKTRLTGAALLRLAELGKLKELNIAGCAVAPLELHRLGEVLPKGCRIVTK